MTSTEVSLDAPVERQDRSASTFGERVAGTGGGEIEEMTDCRLQKEFIDRIFQRHLTPRERKILSLYYGLEEGSEALTSGRTTTLPASTSRLHIRECVTWRAISPSISCRLHSPVPMCGSPTDPQQ